MGRLRTDERRNSHNFNGLQAGQDLAGDAYAPLFLDALASASPRVMRAGRSALEKRAFLVERARLDALLTRGGPAARMVLTLLPRLDYWDALLAALRAAADSELRDVADAVIERLLRRQTTRLPTDHAALEVALARVRADLVHAKGVDDLLKLTAPR